MRMRLSIASKFPGARNCKPHPFSSIRLCQYACIDIAADPLYRLMVKPTTRTAQLQVRVTPSEKAAIARAARRAGVGMSEYVLARALPNQATRWQEWLRQLVHSDGAKIELAGLSSWLSGLGAVELPGAIDTPPRGLSDFHANYVAAMAEHLCAARGVEAPHWTLAVAPLARPVFASDLKSLRLHLLAHSPPPFRRRNIFVDSVVGGQV